MPGEQETRRLFFALWPDEAIRREIVRRRNRLDTAGLRRVPDHNLHLTLLFLGDLPADSMPAITQSAGEIRGEVFELVLDRFGWFPRPQVVWLGGRPPEAGKTLAAELESAMAAREVKFDRRPWRPHVTLFRKVAHRPEFPPPPPLVWPAREFALVESVAGEPYRVLKTWPLC